MEIYTDGACHPNPGKGSWAFIVVNNNTLLHENYGLVEETTNNRMELKAVIEAIKYCEGKSLTIYSDSLLTVNTYNEWMHKWVKKGFKKKKNVDLVKELLELYSPEINLKHIKAHNGHIWNEYVDGICNKSLGLDFCPYTELFC